VPPPERTEERGLLVVAEQVRDLGEATVRDACQELARGGFHCLPVVDAHGALLGLVTTSDLIRALLEADDD